MASRWFTSLVEYLGLWETNVDWRSSGEHDVAHAEDVPTSSSAGRRLGMMPAGLDFGVVAGCCVLLMLMLRLMKYMAERMRKKMKKRIDLVKAMRAAFKDGWRGTNGYSWDMVLVFDIHLATQTKLKAPQVEFNMKRVLNDLADGGVETKLFYNVQRKLVYCKLRVNYKRLKNEADRIDFKVCLDPFACEAALLEGKMDGDREIWRGVRIPNDKEQTPYDPCSHVYAAFRYDTQSQYLYTRYGEKEIFFRGVDRIKLLMSILEAKKYDGGCGLDLRKMKYQKALNDYYFMHDLVELRTLESKFLTFVEMPWNMPVDDVKDYFGEKVGFYFLFLGHYTSWLGLACVLGFCAYCDVAANDGDPNAPSMPYFAVLMAVWTQLFLEFWKRKQVRYAMQWGMRGHEQEVQPRPEFVGEFKPDPVKGRPYLYFPKSIALRRSAISTTLIAASVLVVVGVVAAIFAIEVAVRNARSAYWMGENQSRNIAAIMNVIQIQIFNVIYGGLARLLNDYENHRTDNQFEDALIAKTFVFQFINSFAALFYLAFARPFFPSLDNCYISCLSELSDQLFWLVVGNLLSGNFSEIVVPGIMQWWHKRGEKDHDEYDFDEITEIERESFKDDYDALMGTFEDYCELMMQFGYTTLFVASFPLAPMLAFVSNYVEIRVDAWKLCQLSKRPEPMSAEDIGTWQRILELMSLAAVLSNSALIAYTSTTTQDYSWSTRNWIFFGVALLIMGAKWLVDVLVPDVPEDVAMQIKRADFVVSKILYDAEDDVDLAVDPLALKAEFKVRVIDDDPL